MSDFEELPRAVAAEPSASTEPDEPQPQPTSEPRPPEQPTEARRRWRFVGSFPFLVLMALVVAIIIKSFLVQAFYIPSPSMEPTLQMGDRVLVNKLAYRFGDVHRQDVIVFVNPNSGTAPDRGPLGGFLHWLGEGIGVAQPENEDYIKRVVGLPGETVEIRNQIVMIDGAPLAEPYLTMGAKECNGDFGPVTVPDGALFMMGDNRCNSADSRFGLGFVSLDTVVGHAFVIIWPPSDLGGL
jgi:signal peptidase I